jgi:signal transduction histidine kinase
MDLFKIIKSIQRRIRNWKIQHFVLTAMVGWTLILSPITFPLYLEYCRGDLRELRANLNSQLQQIHSNLVNSRWALTRFSFLRNHFFRSDEKILNSLEGIFLPGFSLGNQNEYFLLRDLTGSTKLEAVRGALVSRHSRVLIPNEKAIVNRGEGVTTTPCQVDDVTYLCILSTPEMRRFKNPNEAYVSVAVIARDQFYSLARASEVQQYSRFRTDQPGFHFSFDPPGLELPSQARASLFRQKLEVYPGFWISLSYPWPDFFLMTFGMISVLTLIVTALGIFINYLFEMRIKSELEFESFKNQRENYEAVQFLVKGVIHDIESPLAALRVLAHSEEDPDRKGMFDLLFKRVRLIVSDLEGKGNSGGRIEASFLPMIPILRSIVLQKQKELAGRFELNLDCHSITSAWSLGVYSDFCRMLSNLMNNAAQASPQGSVITVELVEEPGFAVAGEDAHFYQGSGFRILIRDQGKGIPAEFVDQLFKKGATFGKSGGSGIGLFHARSTARSMKGDVLIRPNPFGGGTEVEMSLPALSPPQWYRPEIQIPDGGRLIVVDDEEIIQKVFQDRILKLGLDVNLNFYSHPNGIPQELIEDSRTFFIVDNNYGTDLSAGLKFCQNLPADRTLLFTSDWNLKAIQIQAEALGIALMGKEFLDQLVFKNVEGSEKGSPS